MSEINNKYELIESDIPGLFRIKALRDIPLIINKGGVGGYVAGEHNLSYEGRCWVGNDAKVTGRARVRDNAQVYGNAIVTDYAQIMNDAVVGDRACVSGSGQVRNSARVTGSAIVDGSAYIIHEAQINGNAYIGGEVCIKGRARITDDVELCNEETISFGTLRTVSVEDLLRCSLGVYPVNGKVRLYKRVNGNMSSAHDQDFFYPEKGIVSVEDYNPDPYASCASGLHFGTNENWPWEEGHRILAADVALEDIICIAQGKVRCKKAEIIGIAKS